jgi:two-component system, NarL family, sensor histidine kinase UhpB
MSLRLKINLLVGLLTVAFVIGLLSLQIGNMRDSVKEEVVAANRVAAQLLNRMGWLYAAQGTPAMLGFLQGVGRVRSNEITLFDGTGAELYRSPPSPYKAGQNAPAWFDALISPPPSEQVFNFPDGRLVVRANASRAALDSWQSFVGFTGAALAMLVLVNVLVYWVVGRTVRPFGRIVEALGQLQGGRFDVALPPLPGTEAAAIGAAFNRMVQVLRERIDTERQLSDSRELTRWIDHHIEKERLLIARELHDELGQSVTAIRSLALSVAQRTEASDETSAQAARLIAEESSRLYDAMHGLIPRLTPLVLDSFGLGAALQDLAERTRRSQPDAMLDLRFDLAGQRLSPDAALALYRAAQEGITNALRHGQAHRLQMTVSGTAEGVVLSLQDDGSGLPPDWQQRPGHHGLRWLQERVAGQGGSLLVQSGSEGGVLLRVTLPPAAVDVVPDTVPQATRHTSLAVAP